MKAPLTVINYFFPHVQISADPQFNPEPGASPPDCSVKVTIQHDNLKDLYQVSIQISSAPENESSRQAYSIDLVVVGLFKVSQDWPDPEKLLSLNGVAILYSAAREFVITITGRGPWGPVIIPTLHFQPKESTKKSSSSAEEEDLTTENSATNETSSRGLDGKTSSGNGQ